MIQGNLTFEQLPQAIDKLIGEVASLRTLIQKTNSPPAAQNPIDIDAACQILQKAKSTLYRLVQKRKIPCYKVGNKLYFFEAELREYISKNKRQELALTVDEIAESLSTNIRHKPKHYKI